MSLNRIDIYYSTFWLHNIIISKYSHTTKLYIHSRGWSSWGRNV